MEHCKTRRIATQVLTLTSKCRDMGSTFSKCSVLIEPRIMQDCRHLEWSNGRLALPRQTTWRVSLKSATHNATYWEVPEVTWSICQTEHTWAHVQIRRVMQNQPPGLLGCNRHATKFDSIQPVGHDPWFFSSAGLHRNSFATQRSFLTRYAAQATTQHLQSSCRARIPNRDIFCQRLSLCATSSITKQIYYIWDGVALFWKGKMLLSV